MAIEIERKFKADPATLAAVHREILGGEGAVIAMETTYYDTPDKALSQKFYTLRCRKENDRSVCTLKTPAKDGRNEYEVVANSIEEALPELCKLSGETLPTDIIPICGAKFTRIAQSFPFITATVEMALDQGKLYGGGQEIDLCEIEVELIKGSPLYLDLYAMKLSEKYDLQPEKRSKFRRALALAEGETK